MQTYEWGIIAGLFSVLSAVAGFLAIQVIKQGQQIAALEAGHDGTEKRFDRQDRLLEAITSKLDELRNMIATGNHPYRGN